MVHECAKKLFGQDKLDVHILEDVQILEDKKVHEDMKRKCGHVRPQHASKYRYRYCSPVALAPQYSSRYRHCGDMFVSCDFCIFAVSAKVIPLFDLLTFPQVDYSLDTWVQRVLFSNHTTPL